MSPTPPPPDRPKAIFFDAAGTLFRLHEPVGRTYARIAAHHGLRVGPDLLEPAFRTVWRLLPPPLHPEDRPPADDDHSWWRELVRRTFSQATGTIASDALFEELYSHYRHASAWRLHEETMASLVQLSQRSRLLVLSNFDRRLHSILKGLGIARYFEQVIISSEVGAAKPHPRMFRAALAACGLPPEDCLHVGDDRRADAAGAAAAGIACFEIRRPGATLQSLVEKLAAGDFPACIRSIPD